ncbi:hypothetical protein [Aliiroseovarius sediminis]|uniref:hypothetical protein n=1 Tax=Aliiroseovarius sediminis TaxID=2925839 RepID=UPI001F5900EE|nr:hypothetical protein [Aliiroseovarius sediminis]MCI2395746.1 hypothetical protein [Aliiroseovarius sediminis]
MSSFVLSGTLAGAGLQYVSGVTDLEVAWHDGAPYLYSTTGYGGGATVFSITNSGVTQAVDQTAYSYSLMASPSAQIEFLEYAGQSYFVTYGRYDWLLDGIKVDHAGHLGGSVQLEWDAGGQGNLSAMTSTTIDGVAHVYAANATSTGFVHYTIDSTHQLLVQDNLSTPSGTGAADIADLEVLSVDENPVLIALSQHTHGLKSYTLDESGSPVEVSAFSADAMLPISVPTALTTGTVAGQAFAIVASSGTSSLTVLKVNADGTLEPVDHVIDNLWTRFHKVTEVTSVQVDDRLFVVAGGADDGLSLFTLLPDGKLVLLDTVADSHATALQNIASLTAEYVGGKIQVYATSETETGITQFEVDPGSIGFTLQGDGSASQMTGTARNDILDGGAGNDHINGGAGDDILHDGTGQDGLTGGAGADIFVLTADDQPDTITDFEAGIDQLDLSDFFMLYDANQLNIISRHWGADIIYRNEVIHVHSASGTALTAQDFTTKDTLALDRPASGFNYIPQIVEGTPGADILVGNKGVDTLKGGDGNDTFLWSEGADFFNGGTGRDTVSYAAAPSAVVVNLGANDSNGAAAGDQYKFIEGIVGSAFSDVLIGNHLENVLTGGAGNDVLHGGRGADLLDGGSGRDTASYSAMGEAVIVSLQDNLTAGAAIGDMLFNIESLTGSAHSDTLTGNHLANTLTGLAGADTLNGGAGNDYLLGGAGDDILISGEGSNILDGGSGTDCADYSSAMGPIQIDMTLKSARTMVFGDTLISIENINGSSFDDTIIGDENVNIIRGLAGDDLIRGGGGDDRLLGDAGNDTLFGGDGNDGLIGGAGDDWISGERGNDKLSGGDGNDRLVGGPGHDVIWGGNGHDQFIDSGGNDRYLGGTGWDTVDYSAWGSHVRINLQHGKGVVAGSVDRFRSIENAIGTDHDDFVIGSHGSNRIIGGGGNDDLRGQGGADQLYGGNGQDSLFGGNGNDRLFGDDGDDILKGENGHDILAGGKGHDHLYGGAGWDTASYSTSESSVVINLIYNVHSGGAFGDKLFSIENIFGSDFNDILIGSRGANSLYGGAGNDRFKGMGGNDKLYGGDGDDIFIVAGQGAEKYDGGHGSDTVVMTGVTSRAVISLIHGKGYGSMAGDTFVDVENLVGSDFDDKFIGNSANNRLLGRNGNDILRGASGDDTLNGGNGDDHLNGNSGTDILLGGNGRDVLSGDWGDDILTGGDQVDVFTFNDGNDRITDFDENHETIRIWDGLWGGGHKTPQEILSYAQIIDGDAVFDFGDGNSLTVEGIDQLDLLHDNVFLL